MTKNGLDQNHELLLGRFLFKWLA